MNQTDTRERSESSVDTTRAGAGGGREYTARVASSLRRGVGSGAVAAIAGGTGLLGGFRALLRGERKRGLVGLVLGAALLAVAVTQRRSRRSGRTSDLDEADVVGTGPDVESIADEAGGAGDGDHAVGEAASSVVDTSPDVEDAASGLESGTEPDVEPEPDTEAESDTESTSVDQRDDGDAGVDSRNLAEASERESGGGGEANGREAVDRLGEAAFDGQSHEVPAPQRAFNRGFLAHSTEAFWGVRDRDDAVLVAQDYDAVEGRDGVRYVASSAIGDDVRELPIPDTVLDHWDEVFGGGTAVAGGDGILFATTDDLAADGVLWVLPAAWAEDEFGEPK